MILSQFFLGTRLSDTGNLATLQLLIPSLKPRNIHTQMTKHNQGNKSFTSILPKFVKICAQSALEHRQKQRLHVFDRGWQARFTPVRAPTPSRARPRALAGPQPPVHRAVPIKQPKASAIHPRALSVLPEPKFTGLRLEHAAPPPAKPPDPRPPWPAPSRHFQAAPVARLASPVAREAFQVLGPGRASPETQDRPRWTSVTAPTRRPSNLVSHSQIPRAHVFLDLWWSSLNRSIELYCLVRPDSSPPTSSPACVRGPTYSYHHRRWSTPRRDRKRPPDLARPFTGATSPPVSPSALFFRRGHCSIRGGLQVQFGKTLGDFLQSRRLRWIVNRWPVCNTLKTFRQGPSAKPFFLYPFLFILFKFSRELRKFISWEIFNQI
jgi:hypothetical protein